MKHKKGDLVAFKDFRNALVFGVIVETGKTYSIKWIYDTPTDDYKGYSKLQIDFFKKNLKVANS